MKRGFSLLELVIALSMAALISLSLFQLLTTTRKSVRRINNVIEVDVPFMAFYNQIEKDVLGMFAPRSAIQWYAKKEKTEKGDQSLLPAFALDGKQDSLYLSFITTGGLSVLEKDGSLIPTPAMKRVAYLLERDPARPGVMRLMYRFSGTQLSAQALKQAQFSPSYELITGIKNFEIECTLIEMVEKKKADTKSKETAKKTSTVLKDWNEEEIWKKYKSLIPAYIRLKGTILDLAGLEYPFDMLIRIPSYRPFQEKEEDIFEKIENLAKEFFKPKK